MKPTPKLLVLLGSSLLATVTSTYAQSVWKGSEGADGNLWAIAGNWDPSGAPGSGADVVFDGTGTNLGTSFNGTAFTLGSLTFTADQTAAVTINTVVGTPLTFNPGTVVSVAAGSHKFVGTGTASSGTSRDMLFAGTSGDTFTFDIASGASFEIQGRVATSGTSASTRNFVKTGAGTLVLSGFNGSSGGWNHSLGSGFQIQQGALRFAQLNAAGNSANNYIVSSGAALELDGGFNQGFNNGTITLNGTGIGTGGALRSISGNNAIVGSGTGGIDLVTNSSIGVVADTLTIGQVVKGSGNLTKVGFGTLTLSGANTYTGSTAISDGTLEVRGSIASSSGITNAAALVFNSDLAQSYGNAIGGSGSLTKQGDGTLTLSANNSYTGATIISQGVLQIGNGGTTGTLGAHSHTSIASGAELRIDRSTGNFGYAYTGELSGSGTVNIPDSRRFNFQTNNQTASGSLSFIVDGILGINTGSGVTAVHLGELSGSGTIQRAGAAPSNPPLTVLTIGGKNTSSTYSGNITNIAEFAIEKTGSGTLTLSGVNGYGGPTTISGGALALGADGSINNTSGIHLGGGTFDVSAKSGYAVAKLSGNGNVLGSLSVSTELAIGNSAGTIHFNDELTLGAASIYTYELTGGGSAADLGIVSGTLTIDSGAILDLVQLGTYTLDDRFTLFAYQEGNLSGTFSGLGQGATFTAAGGLWQIDYFDTDPGLNSLAGDGTRFVNITAIPEPRAALLGGIGLLALLRRRRD